MSNDPKADANDMLKGQGPASVKSLVTHALFSAENFAKLHPANTPGAILHDDGNVYLPGEKIPDPDNPWPEDLYTLVKPSELLSYDTTNDTNALFNDRWVCRGGAGVLVGATGEGKSSLMMQAACCWALGRDLFGIKPVRPLKSLIIQAENDQGDLAEMYKGVVNGLNLASMLPQLDENISFISECGKSGEEFIKLLRHIVGRERPDVLWVDPYFAYHGGNVSDQEATSRFLRGGLNPILKEFGCAAILVHHTNKPPRDPVAKNALSGSDFSYLGSGSAELANWARMMLVLRGISDGVFEFRAAKRGKRAGLVDSHGNPTDRVLLRHGQQGICWERSIEAEKSQDEDIEVGAADVEKEMEKGKTYERDEVRILVQKTLGLSRSTVFKNGTVGNRVWRRVLDLCKCPHAPNLYQARPASEGVQSESSGHAVQPVRAPLKGADELDGKNKDDLFSKQSDGNKSNVEVKMSGDNTPKANRTE